MSTPSAGLWWFATLALLGLAGAGYALGRLHERRLRWAELFAVRSRHAALLANLVEGVWSSDARHRLKLLPEQSPAGTSARDQPPLWWHHPDLQQALKTQRAFFDLQLQCAPPSADAVPRSATGAASGTASTVPGQPATTWWVHGQPLMDQEGHFAGYVGTARAQAALEGKPVASPDAVASAAPLPAGPATATATADAAETAAKTAAANSFALEAARAQSMEADNFSFTVAHDLRAPIRVVDGFTRIVQEDYGHLLDRVANDHLERVLNAAARMNKMIDALLTLARLSNQPLTRQPVNLSQVAHYVMDELRRAQPGREVDVTIEAALLVTGDPTLLRLVLENLLGNAWKYSARTPKAQISLSAVPHGSGRAFVVRDNGAGFDMRAAERLFGVFQRLHSASEFAGHGVGLASAQRIVRRHGGTIWAEAEPARGAAFSFTLTEEN